MKSIKRSFVQTLLSVLFLCICNLFISCGGGGGGAAGASIPADQYSTHNPGGWGGGGNSGTSSGGSSTGGNTGVTLQGSTPLIVTGYTFNGATYSDLASLTLAMTDVNATGSFTVPFTVSGESSPRTARVTKTSEGYSVEHQYKATYYVNVINGVDATELWYYANNGFDLSADTGTNVDGWQDSNGGYHRGGVIRGVQGDITLTQVLKGTDFTIQPTAPDTANEVVTGIYKLANTSDGFSFAATPSVSGATYTWTFNNGAPVSGPNSSISVTPDSLALNVSRRRSSATPINVHCVVTKEGTTTKESDTTIMVYMPDVLPDAFEIADSTYNPPVNPVYRVTSLDQPLYFSWFMAGGSFPATGTTYVWKVGDDVVASGPEDYCNISAADMGYTAATIPTSESAASTVTKRITCTVSNPDAETSSNNTSVSAYLDINVWKLTIPDVNVNIPLTPSTATQATINGETVYKLRRLSGSFQASAVLDDNSFSDAKYYWHIAKIGGGSLDITPDTTPSSSSLLDINLGNSALAAQLGISGIGDLSTNPANPDRIIVTCTVKHDDLPDSEAKISPQKIINICRDSVPQYRIEVEAPSDIATETVGGNTVYLVTTDDLTSKNYTLRVVPSNAEDTLNPATQYEWSFDQGATWTTASTDNPIQRNLAAMFGISNPPTSMTPYSIKCRASLEDAQVPSSIPEATIVLNTAVLHTVTYNSMGGTAVTAQNVVEGRVATAPSDPTKEGASFVGWYTGTVNNGIVTLNSTAYDFTNTAVTDDITLYAKWNYTNFSGTVADLMAAEFTSEGTYQNNAIVTITDVTDENINQLVSFLNNYKNTAFYYKLIIQGTLTQIPDNAFGSSSHFITTVTLPDTVKTIGYKAFSGCNKMYSFNMPGVEEIGEMAFNWYDTGSLSLNSLTNLRKIGQKAFFDIAGGSIGGPTFTIPATVEEIYSNSFLSNKSMSITFAGTNSWTKWQGDTVIDTNVTLTTSLVTTNSSPVYRYTRNP